MQQVRLFFIALQFFTRLPIPGWVGFEASWLQHASRYFPLVGCVVAAIAAAVYALAALVLPAPVAAVLSTAASIYSTGAFHEDGFADTCDGLGGGMTRERVLEIMKDSRVGAYGAIGIACMLATKLSALSMLPPRDAVAALLLAHPLSRLAATALIWRLAYVRGEGKAKPLAHRMTHVEFAIATLGALLPAAVLLAFGWVTPAAVLGAVLACLLAAFWLGRIFVRRLGGYTGDCLGAVQQVAEALAYVAVLATLGHGAWTAS
ncbi:adenosylcobinamide-GDP ribazoletransferase [Massilia forsythiae]|uniref:Adenosylcobinamide-GDP ribazoletransferase n=1 Tax=Massilia forsythiae TaxID=2728020 RepID=A0A7Z2VUG0_9BURK|nr:adenosylcobinamide-GDP ribazoletransferase [Massilia forsythiae]QJD99413.1 adenosylcobinamide-GDP ribazoletransferase [Massilia forsythiae]